MNWEIEMGSGGAPEAGCVDVHFLRRGFLTREEAESVLSREERERAVRFRFAEDAGAWAGWRAGMRRVLGDCLGLSPAAVPLETGEKGKPFLAEPHGWLHFSLSHCRELAVVVVSREGPVGVDLEPRDRAAALLECVEMFCSPEEIAALPEDGNEREEALLRIWTAKEAVLKALGVGLSFPPERLRIEGGRARCADPLPGLEGIVVAFPEAPEGHRMALAGPESAKSFVFINH